MSINPTDPGSIDKTAAGRLRKVPARSPADARRSSGPAPQPPKPDQVEISDGARQLLESQEGARGASGDLSPEQFQLILERIAQGFYDRPEIRDLTLPRLLPDICHGRSS